MNLGKLLFAGKSVIGGSGAIQYRENKQVCLPKFISPKNPFAPKKPAEAAPAPTPTTNGTVAPPVSSAPKPAASWTAKLNPASIWRGPRPEAKNDSPPAVQAELSLDAVKVVHNDLTDADVEVVPFKSRPAAEIPDLPPAKKPWEILGERLLKVTAL